MAASARFELAHATVKVWCLTAWLRGIISGGGRWIWTIEPEGTDLQSAAFGHFAIPPNLIFKNNNGAGNRTWTHNLLITSQLLYQLSYSGTWWAIQDSNLWPPACKAGALTNWANRPDIEFLFFCHSLADKYNITMYYQRCQRFFKIFFIFF